MFSTEYLKLCHKAKAGWVNKKTVLGDWYIDWEQKTIDVVSGATIRQVDFNSQRYTYLPSIDDLLELMDNQVEAWGDDPAQKELKITYDPQKKWCLEVGYAGRLTMAGNQDTIQELLYRAVSQMIYFDPADSG